MLQAAADGREEKRQRVAEEEKAIVVLREGDAAAAAAVPDAPVVAGWVDRSETRDADIYKSGLVVVVQRRGTGKETVKRQRCTVCNKTFSFRTATDPIRVYAL